MECTIVRTQLFRKIDGELSAFESGQLEAHLAQCASCAREYRLLTLPGRIVQAIPTISPSPYFVSKLRAQIESEVQSIAIRQVIFGLARRVVPALAGITLALLSVFAYFELRGPQADLYQAYDRFFISEDQPHRMFIAEQGDITDESVLQAIAERESTRH
jgi:predicted anti-sigma-YlaC factor YlaD